VTSNEQPATSNKQPATSNKQPATSNKQPATSNKQPATSNKQPATSNKQPATSIKLVFWLYALFVVYGATLPLHPDFTRSGMRHRWKHAERIPFLNSEGGRLSLGDAVGNILLFVPFGLFLQSWRQSRRLETAASSHDPLGISPSLLAALAFSGTIECGQLFLDGRVTSVNDVLTNLLGAFIGARLAVTYPGLVANIWEALQRMARRRPLWAFWMATMAVQTMIALAPFDFTLKKESFQRQWLRWQYSWQELKSSGQIFSSAHIFLRQFPHTEHLAAVLFTTAGCSALLGAFLILGCQRYGNSSLRLIWGATLITFGFYPALAIAQFAVQSVRPFVFFPVVGLCGVIFGAGLMFVFSLFTVKWSGRRK
jgi:glycopeptide antibiotics resistance protein